ncbi:MAG TPA: MBL fold metallo-hydrolase, partial [Planctomycetes bacterium]|nr:MBL fold metallo-hydrolase [Planctomycetota bacterium]
MKPLSPRFLSPLAFLSLFVGAVLFGQTGEDDADPARVAGAVSYYRGSGGGNVGIQSGADGVLVVDDKFDGTTEEVAAAIHQVAGSGPDFLINTHHHGDHTGGNGFFGKAATIFAQENVRKRLEEEGHTDLLPTVTYRDGVTLHYNGEEVRVIHFEHGHTDGDSVVWFTGSKVIHMGDLYFQVGYPFVDTAAGGSVQGLIAAVDRVLEMLPEGTRVIPGHGVAGGIEGLREYRHMLQTVLERVSVMHGEGFGVDEMVEAGVTEDFDDR